MIAATLQRLKGTERIWIWFVLLPLAFAAVPLIFVTFASWDAVSPNGSEAGLWLAVLLVIPALLAIPVLLLCLVGLLFRNIRFYSAAGAWISLVFVVAFTGSVWIGESIRMNAFHHLQRAVNLSSKRSAPLRQGMAVRLKTLKLWSPSSLSVSRRLGWAHTRIINIGRDQTLSTVIHGPS